VAAAVLTEARLADDEKGPLCPLPALSSSGGQHPHRQSHAGQAAESLEPEFLRAEH